jgi:hypothetical protein
MTIEELIEKLKKYPRCDYVKFYVPSKKSFYYPAGYPTIRQGQYRGQYIDLWDIIPIITYDELIEYSCLCNPKDQIVMFLDSDHGICYVPLC